MSRRGFIGVDIGGSVMAAGVVTPEGEVVAQGQDPTHKRGPGTAVATLLDLVQRMHLAARAFGVTVEGIEAFSSVLADRMDLRDGLGHVLGRRRTQSIAHL